DGNLSRGRVYSFLVGRWRKTPVDIAWIRRALVRRGVDAGILNEITDVSSEPSDNNSLPNAETLYRAALLLPLCDRMTEGEIKKIRQAAAEAAGRAEAGK
ncbi:MAG TPA: hypothetical protein VJC03_06350, partial [bacterium]|nr:hypothetical protein [bacterium]